MKAPFVSELEPNKGATGVFLVQSKEVRQKKSGEPYLSMTLVDRTGELDAKMWDNVAEVADTFGKDDFIKVRGLLQVYNNRLQFTVHKLVKVDEAGVDPADFFAASSRNPDEMFDELWGVIRAIGNRHIRALLELVFSDEDVARRYRKAPAAKFIHHAYLGGLIEHVLSLCGLCRAVAAHYPAVDLDLLLAGALLHDIGKIYELSYDRSFGYTSDGQLLGHIFIGTRMVEEKLARLPDFPPKLRSLLQHLIISHHGALEFGSPKLPLFQEALILHYLDDLDAKMECMRVLVQQDRQVDGEWTAYSNSLERVVLKKLKYLAGEEDRGGADTALATAAASPEAPDPASPVAAVPPLLPLAPESDPAPTAAREPGPLAPPAAVPPPRPRPAPVPSTPSLFGEKLLGALREGK